MANKCGLAVCKFSPISYPFVYHVHVIVSSSKSDVIWDIWITTKSYPIRVRTSLDDQMLWDSFVTMNIADLLARYAKLMENQLTYH